MEIYRQGLIDALYEVLRCLDNAIDSGYLSERDKRFLRVASQPVLRVLIDLEGAEKRETIRLRTLSKKRIPR